MIPRKFHVNLPHKLQKLVTLFSPGGKFWHVETCRTGEDMFFQKGWSEFAKAHNLQTGYFLVFRYEGNMIFKVKIFDSTGCLKDYSPASHSCLDSSYIEIESSSETRDQTSSRSSNELKSHNLKKRNLADGEALEIDKRKRRSSSQETLKEQKDTKEGNVDSNRQFEKILTLCYISHSYLSIPKVFCMNNGLLTGDTIYLKESSSGGRSWPVNVGKHGYLTKGWKEFREAAGLKEGDRCIFRLESENSLVVTVITQESDSTREREGKTIDGPTSSIVAKEEERIQKQKRSSRPILEWESTVRPYNITNSYQPLGKTFCLDNNLTSPRDVTLRDLKGKEWHAKFNINEREGRLSRTGWTNFSREYGLNNLGKTFYLNNNLMSPRDITLNKSEGSHRKSGKDWHAKFYLNKSEGRFDRAGWNNFSREQRLNAGDKCIFKVIQEDVLLIRVIKN